MWMLKACGWAKRWWMWLVAGAAGLLAFFLIRRKRGTPLFDDVEDKRKAIEQDISKRRGVLEEQYENKKAALKKEQEEKRKVIVSDIKWDTNVVHDDPEKTNDYLIDVDKEMR